MNPELPPEKTLSAVAKHNRQGRGWKESRACSCFVSSPRTRSMLCRQPRRTRRPLSGRQEPYPLFWADVCLVIRWRHAECICAHVIRCERAERKPWPGFKFCEAPWRRLRTPQERSAAALSIAPAPPYWQFFRNSCSEVAFFSMNIGITNIRCVQVFSE